MRLVNLLILAVLVAIFLAVRSWWDARREKALDIEVVREDEEFLGTWGIKSKEALILLRLRRDETFVYKQVNYPLTDTFVRKGHFTIEGPGLGRSTIDYPRLIVITDDHDTLFNHFIAYITPYNSTVDKVDRLVLNQHSIYDTLSTTFYRIKQ